MDRIVGRFDMEDLVRFAWVLGMGLAIGSMIVLGVCRSSRSMHQTRIVGTSLPPRDGIDNIYAYIHEVDRLDNLHSEYWAWIALIVGIIIIFLLSLQEAFL